MGLKEFFDFVIVKLYTTLQSCYLIYLDSPDVRKLCKENQQQQITTVSKVSLDESYKFLEIF